MFATDSAVKTQSRSDRSVCLRLIYSGYFLYLCSIAIKMCYSAELVEIIDAFGTTKAQAGVGLTVYYLVYAAAQILLGVILPKIDLKKFLCVAVVCSALSFAAVPAVRSLTGMWIILGLNGIFQCGIFGGCMHFFGKYAPADLSAFSVKLLSTGFAFGTALAYGASALFIAFLNWQATFVFFALLCVLTLVFFLRALSCAQRTLTPIEKEEKVGSAEKKSGALSLLIGIVFLTAISTTAYYAVSNWFPSLLRDVHGMPSSYSLALTVLLPLTMMPGPLVVQSLADRHGHCLAIGTACIFIETAAIGVMCLCFDRSIVSAALFTVIFLFFSRSVNNLLSGYVPMKLRRTVNTGSFSLVINAVSCVGAAFAPTVAGRITDVYGWSAYYLVLFVFLGVTLLSFALCTAAFRKHTEL